MTMQFIDRAAPFALDPAISQLGNEREGLAIDFVAMRAYVRDRSTPANFFLGGPNDLLTYASPSAKNIFNNAGTLVSGSTLRTEYDPETAAARGIRTEPQATNYLANSVLAGGAAGSPGTLPTGVSESLFGITRTVVGTGVEDGINYVDLRLQGTASQSWILPFVMSASGVFSAGLSTTLSIFMRMVGGSFTNIQYLTVYNRANLSPSGSVDTTVQVRTQATAAASLGKARHQVANIAPAGTLTGGGSLLVMLNGITGVIDITLRIGLPQYERGASASSPIRTTGSAVTRAADDIKLAVSKFPYLSSAGTLLVEGAVGAYVESGFMARLHQASDKYVRVGEVFSGGLARRGSMRNGGTAISTTAISPTVAFGAAAKVAIAWNGGDFVVSGNGGISAPVNLSDGPPVATSLVLNSGLSDASGVNPMHLKRVVFIPRRLSDGDLQARTTL